MNGTSGALAMAFVRAHVQEAARAAEELDSEDMAGLLTRLPENEASRLLAAVLPSAAAQALERMDQARAAALVLHMDPQWAGALLARMGEAGSRRLLESLAPGPAREIKTLMSYPEDSAGSLMDPRVPVFRPNTQVREILGQLHLEGIKRVDDVYVVDEEGVLTGSVALQEVAAAQPETELGSLLKGGTVSIHAMAPRDEVLEIFSRVRMATLPVVDSDRKLLGAIPNEELVTASAEEVSADIQTMVGVSAEERVFSGSGFAIRRRLPWLLLNLLTAFLAAFVVGIFEKTIAQVTALAVLLPVVAGQSGNTGAQTLAVLMRGLALREIRPSQWLRAAGKEVLVALFNGAVIGLVAGIGVFLWSGSLGMAGVILLSMVVAMAAAAVSGVAIPLGLAAMGQDPAQSSSILLTTVTDVVGFLAFLGLATMMLGLL